MHTLYYLYICTRLEIVNFVKNTLIQFNPTSNYKYFQHFISNNKN